MTGTYDTGSVVYAKNVPTAELAVGDVITYAPPAGASPTALVTHRIAAITRGPRRPARVSHEGRRQPGRSTPGASSCADAHQARVAFSVPFAGFVFIALADRDLRMLLIGGPALLVAFSVLLGMIRDARAESRSRPRAAGRARRDARVGPAVRPRRGLAILLGLGVLASRQPARCRAPPTPRRRSIARTPSPPPPTGSPRRSLSRAPAAALRASVTLAATAADVGSGVASRAHPALGLRPGDLDRHLHR